MHSRASLSSTNHTRQHLKTSLHLTSTASGLSSLTGVHFAFALVWFSHQQFFTLFSHDFPSPPLMPQRIAALAFGFSVCSYKHTGITMQKLEKYERLLALRVNWKMIRWEKNVWWAQLQLQLRREGEKRVWQIRQRRHLQSSMQRKTTIHFLLSLVDLFTTGSSTFTFFYTLLLFFFCTAFHVVLLVYVVCSTACFKNQPALSCMRFDSIIVCKGLINTLGVKFKL